MGFKDHLSCPLFPIETLEFSTRVQWSWVAAKKHVTEVRPRIHVTFKCPSQIRTKDTPQFGECPVNDIIREYVETQRFRSLLRENLLRLGGSRMTPYIDTIIRGFSLEEPERTQITDKNGTKYIKSRAVVSSPLFGKWHKIPPGFRNLTEAGDLAQVVDSPPEKLLKEEKFYCSLIK